MTSTDIRDAAKRDPLEPGRIEGQHPATPERLPGHTRYHADEPSKSRRPEEIAGVPAFLFESGRLLALTLDQSGANLPPLPDAEPWRLSRYVSLSDDELRTLGLESAHVLRILAADGTFRWQPSD